MKIAIIIIVLALVVLMLLFLAGMAVSIGASEEMYREFDDAQQEEYIRKWQEKKARRKERRHK